MIRLVIAALLLAAGSFSVVAHDVNPVDPAKLAITQYRIDAWATEQGLPMNTVQSVFQGRDGQLWIGTGGGLTRFDGIRFASFEASSQPDPTARPVFGFTEDPDGTLWIGHSRGASRYRDGRFERAWPDELLEGRRVWAFARAHDGVMWAATENGLVRWEKGEAKIFKEADGLPTRRLRALAFDKDGTLWIATTGGGLVSYAGGKFNALKPEHGFPHLEVRHVLADPAGGVWAATAGGGLVRVQDGKIRIYGVAEGLPTEQLTYLARDNDGSLWIGTWGAGVVRMTAGRFVAISTANGLAGDQIWSVHVDREGSVWIGTWHGGLNRISKRSFVVFGKPEGLSGDNTRSVIHARDGVTWVATAGGGVNRIEGGKVTAKFGVKEGLSTEEASALFEDRDGAIWIATYTGGIARLKNNKIENFGTAHGIPNVDVRVVYRDRSGILWVGTSSGLAQFDGKRFIAVPGLGAQDEGITTILEERSGTLWIGTAGAGLIRHRDGKFERFMRKDGLASNWIVALHEDANGTLWIGTNGEGITRYKNGQFKSIRLADGLWDGLAQAILEDSSGHFWITCNRGFYRVARADLDAFADGLTSKVLSTGYGPVDALRSTTFAGGLQNAGAIDASGRVWLPSLRGLVIVDPMRLPESGTPPAVSVSEITVNGVGAPPGGEIILPPGSAPLSIRYSSETLLNADRVRFRYKMDGMTRDWVEAGKSREASFPALPHGTYSFHVAGSIDGRRWQELEKPLAITVQPHFYQTAWFTVLAVLVAMATGAALFRLRVHQLRRHHAEMEELVAIKTEELRIANEHLSRLSFADALTGLPNRRRLDEVLDTEWRRAARQETSLAVVIADIDAFKAYNDALGHPRGDACLIEVADVIREATSRASDFAARYGGEEFVILIPSADHAVALAFAESLRRAIEAKGIAHPASTVAPVVTISLGVAARVPAPGSTWAPLVAEADAALYRAKQEGRNRVR
ncbi:ligand-binding sensor domain-containing diguanylate cyclase [Usitatibacter palustris]|uniref:diguanylate cyclase n=1 Tax=Usitatibacter palustris TaxID=2732487 RepID=A0A6M4H6J9_9PROT|nr:ligand-binding sensor domain-containing diguanylate cyclase [Usitatibacter palustris]QJR13577.1 hypothetical protein DSM104440_00361 [Usitatibacter palustris]